MSTKTDKKEIPISGVFEETYFPKLSVGKKPSESKPTHLLLEKNLVKHFHIITFLVLFAMGSIFSIYHYESVIWIMGIFAGIILTNIVYHKFGSFINYEELLGASNDNKKEE